MKTAFQFGGKNEYIGVKANSLIQLDQFESNGKRFRVTYGSYVSEQLTYAEACKELGECLMHHLACEGLIDNNCN